MKASEGHIGRVFVVRLEDGDVLPRCIERFAEEQGISAGHVILVGESEAVRLSLAPRIQMRNLPNPCYSPLMAPMR